MLDSMKDNVKKRVKNGQRKVRKIYVDVSNRLQRSFGTPVHQLAEIHYRGRPLKFSYSGQIETVSMDVIQREQEENKDNGKVEVKFDPTKRRVDISTVHINCSCGMVFKKEIPTATAETRDIKKIIKHTNDIDMQRHKFSGHELKIDYVESQVEVISEDVQIKDWNPERITYYRIFPKKTADVKYLVSYGQDLLAEAEQWQYKDTTMGSSYVRKQNTMFMIFVMGLLMVLEFVLTITAISSQYVITPAQPNTYLPWYLLIIAIVILVSVMWKLHIHDVANQYVKYISLQSAPFYISNRGILPVVMTNAEVDQVWDYQARMMKLEPKTAKDVFYSLATWSDDAIAQLYRAKMIGHVEHELMGITSEIRDLQKLDYDYRNIQTGSKTSMTKIVEAILGTFLATIGVIILMGFMGSGI
ncbi:MAG: hypothetical protein ACYDAP_00045 [Thermoplasmataceae archaeon]